jgi:NADPH-dependent glutamate synthase beta subunit-like oxidoreductase/coenzyme F420-reducing hydrogenase delta subunit/Pyruvate/2-oxoacid:ferredoxin oxidoreductase delta subunit
MCARVKATRPPKSKGVAKLEGPLGEFTLNVEGLPSCTEACLAGIDVKAYINLIADRRYEEAVATIRRDNPFPGVCGRVCTHPCEDECARGEVDDPVAIKALKRFASDYERARRKPVPTPKKPRKGAKRVAIVGAGLAGLTAASDLIKAGYSATVFDSSKSAGGILAWGIPSFRLPKDIVRGEVAQIEGLGVGIRLGETVRDPKALLNKGYSAVILAAGCMAPLPLGIEGEDAAGMLDCVDFLKRVSEGQISSLKGRTVVVGGGNAALDAARVALRLGSDVTLAYRRTRAEMPADDSEVAEGKDEGIRFEFLTIPKRVITKDGQVKGLEVQKARLGELDPSGRRSSVPIPGSEFALDADWIIRAVGNKPDPALMKAAGLKLTPRGAVSTDALGRTSLEGIFAAGDVALGPATVVEAIGSGHAAARGVIEYLGGEVATKPVVDHVLVMERAPDKKARAEPKKAHANLRKSSFEEIETALDELSAVAEASRCRRCGLCAECDVCLAGCEHRQAVLLVESQSPTWVKVPLDISKRLAAEPETRNGWTAASEGRESAARLEPVQASVDPDLCIACGLCEDACAYRAVRMQFTRGSGAVAAVDPAGCRGCGACAAACPTGAISQGFMDDGRLFARVREAASECKGGIVSFSCVWHKSGSLSKANGDVPVICTRRVSPALILETLASGASGVALEGCKDDECHYLPGQWMGADLPQKARRVLDAIGVDGRRVEYFDGGDVKTLASFESRLKKAHLGPLPDTAAKVPGIKSSAGRSIALAHALMARQDSEVPKAKAKYYLASGCSPICDSVMEAHGICGSSRFLESIETLLSELKVDYARSTRLLGPGSRLKSAGLDGLYKEYGKAAISAVKSSGAKTVIAISHEAMSKFESQWPKDFGKLPFGFASLPSILNGSAREGAFKTTPGKIAFHPACGSSANFSSELLKLLGKVPGLEVAVVKDGCGQSSWNEPDAESYESAKDLMGAAASAGAGVLVVESHQCLTHLLAARMGWSEGGVEVVDIYTFLASRLSGVTGRGK